MPKALSEIVKRLNPFKPRLICHPCWTCGTPVHFLEREVWTVNHQCPLGRGMSFTACIECRSNRAATPDRLADLMVYVRTKDVPHPRDDEWELNEDQWKLLENGLAISDAHGHKFGRPVTFWNDGKYLAIKAWLETPAHAAELDKAKERYRLRLAAG